MSTTTLTALRKNLFQLAAHAIASNARLITTDRLIRQRFPNALW